MAEEETADVAAEVADRFTDRTKSSATDVEGRAISNQNVRLKELSFRRYGVVVHLGVMRERDKKKDGKENQRARGKTLRQFCLRPDFRSSGRCDIS